MATISTAVSSEYLKAYDGYDQQAVGIGLQTGTYATPSYAQTKIQNLAIGLLSHTYYSGFDHSPDQLLLPIHFISSEQNILGLNLLYIPETHRRAIMKFVLDSNAARIRANQSMLIDWFALERAIPIVRYITRKYKLIGLRVVEGYTLNEVPKAIKMRSRWQNHYQTLMG